ncbi:MAG: hypothetical protein QXI22_07430 [Sulfolobales archaeon]
MWSSKRVVSISIPSLITALLVSLSINILAIVLVIILTIHLLSISIGFIRIKLRLCPANTIITFRDIAIKNKSLSVKADKIYTSSRITSTIYMAKGYVSPRAFFLNPILLCIFTYFKPLHVGAGEYLALGSAPHFIYIFKSRINAPISLTDEEEVISIMKDLCYK